MYLIRYLSNDGCWYVSGCVDTWDEAVRYVAVRGLNRWTSGYIYSIEDC